MPIHLTIKEDSPYDLDFLIGFFFEDNCGFCGVERNDILD
jgi:hypothetical protein